MTRSERVLGAGLLAAVLLATFGDAGAQPDVMLAWHALLFVAALVAWWVAAPGTTSLRPSAGTALALAALILVLALGFVRAPYKFGAWLTLVEVAAFVAAFTLAIRTGPRLVAWLGPALLCAGWFQIALLLYQRFSSGDPRPAGTFNNPNYLAGWLAATLLFCVGRWLAAPADRVARGSVVAAIPLLAGLVLTGSRGALVGLAAGGVLLARLAWKDLSRAGRKRLLAAFLVVGVAGSVAVFARLQQPDPFRYQRLKIWRASVVPLLDAPWTGTGPGQFARAAPDLQFPDGRGALRFDRGFRTTHSDWIRVAAELGWPGVAAFGWVVVSVGAHLARRRRSRRDPVDVGAVAALGALFAQAGVDNVSRAPALYLLGAVLFGLVVAIEAPSRRPVRPFWRVVVAAVALHLFVVGDVAPWRAWVEREAASPGAGAGWCPADAETAMRRAERRLGGGAAGLEAYADARRDAERAVHLSPRDGELLRRAARIEVAAVGLFGLDRAGRERIAGLYRGSERLQRTNPFVPMELAAFLLDAADPAGARRAAERALEIEPRAVAPRLLLARALLETGEADRASGLLVELEALASEHADEARTGDYARDLLTYDPALLRQVAAGIEAARQARSGDPTFGPEDQEDRAGSDRSVD